MARKNRKSSAFAASKAESENVTQSPARRAPRKASAGSADVARFQWFHPPVFADYMASFKREDGHRLVLGIDPGTNCGYAYGFVRNDGRIVYPQPEWIGTWKLKLSEYDSGAMRWLRLRAFVAAAEPSVVVMEGRDFTAAVYQVAGSGVGGIKAAELLASAKSTVATWCEDRNIPCGTMTIGAVKKRATGIGNAGKELIIAACNREFHTKFSETDYHLTGDDNRADAAFLCALGLEEFAAGLTGGV